MWQRVWVDYRQTHNEEPLPLPMFIHANDLVLYSSADLHLLRVH